MQLYSWQQACLKAWTKNEYRGIVHVITGAGKTLFALAAIDHLRELYPDLQVKIVVPTIPLASQWKNELMHHAPSEKYRPGFYGGGAKDDPSRSVMIYVINSARGALSAHIRRDLSLDRHVLLICDECHHCQSRENRKIFSFLDGIGTNRRLYHCLGLSATPFGTDNDEILKKALGEEIFRYDYATAAAEGVISPFTVCEVSASFLPDEFEKYSQLSLSIALALKKLLAACPSLRGLSKTAFLRAAAKMAKSADMDPSDPAAAFLYATYQRKELTNLAEARIHCAAAILRELPADARILIFCERIEQAEQFSAHLQKEYGSGWGIYHSGLTREARARIMASFRDRQIRILISCKCLDEGIDVPDAVYAIVLSGTSVSRQRIQRLGRIIRRSDRKNAACLYYIYIRESTDDAAYLPALEANQTYSVRFYTAEQAFSNDLYEYAASEILQKVSAGTESTAKTGDAENAMDAEKGSRIPSVHEKIVAELRRCLLEGLIRPDCLLPRDIQRKQQREAQTQHEKNYWIAAEKIGAQMR